MAIRIEVNPRTVWRVVLHGAAAIGIVLLLRRCVTPLAWGAAALLLALALDPAVAWGVRRGIPRPVSAVSIVALVATLVVTALLRTGPDLIEQGRKLLLDLPEFLDRARDHWLVVAAEERFGLVTAVQSELREQAARAPGPLVGAVWRIVKGLGGLFAITVLTVFMLTVGRSLVDSALSWVPQHERPRYRELARRIRDRVGGYVAGTVIIATISGLVMTVTLLLARVPYALPLGLSVAVLGLVPFLGFIISGLLVVITTFLAVGSEAGLAVAAVYVLYQPVENNVLQPLIQRRTIHMNPLVIAGAALLGTFAWGLWGAALALPIAGTLQVILQDILDRRERHDASASGDDRQLVLPTILEETKPLEERTKARRAVRPRPEHAHGS